MVRVGILRPTAAPSSPTDQMAAGIPTALRELGYVEGRNLVVERRWAGGDPERLPVLARELLQAKVDVIVTVGAQATRAVSQATSTVPIVMYGNLDPVALGLVSSLARPGGNVTGVLIAPGGTLAAKRLELLKLAVPRATRFAFLAPASYPAFRAQVQETLTAAAALGIELRVTEVRDGDYAGAFAAIAAQRPGGLLVGAHTYFVRDRAQIIDLAARHRLPAMYEWREQVEDGGLMAYSTSLNGLYRRVASYVDRILKGARPGDMPLEQPTKFELVINQKTAKALGLTIPQSLLLRADEVIQ
jgi:putative ABC transport system substrate-binding protein